MDFRDLSERMKRIEGTASRLEMATLLADTFNAATEEETAPIAYLLLGTLAPEAEGLEVGLADRMVEELIRERTGTSEAELQELMAEEGDLGLVAERLWEDRSGGQSALDAFVETSAETTLSVLDVHQRLRDIAKIEGAGSQEKKLGKASRLLDQASPLEARYLVRFMVGSLRLGVADMTLLDGAAVAYGPEGDAEEDGFPRPPARFRQVLERAYNLTSDIGHVLTIARSHGLEALEDVEITIGKPVRPMLAERASDAETIFENAGTPAMAEYKYDGLRLQAHLGDEEMHLFSRRLEDVTDPYPDVVKALQEALPETPLVVEGEAVPVHPETGRMREFQAIARRRGRKHNLEEAIEEVPIHLYLFDLLYVQDEDLTRTPVQNRRSRLEALLEDHEGVHLSDVETVSTPTDLDTFFEQAIADGAEGVMVKKMGEDSHYQAGARGWRWIKYKKDYVEGLADSLDLVIVGAYHGKGRRAGWYGTLLGAAYNPDQDRFETVCKIGTGFTDEDLNELDELLDTHERSTPHPQVAVELEPDAWFDPVRVAEIRGAELTRSPVHTAGRDEAGGIALRFPRFIRWRDDKGPRDATTISELEQMYRRQTKIRPDEEG